MKNILTQITKYQIELITLIILIAEMAFLFVALNNTMDSTIFLYNILIIQFLMLITMYFIHKQLGLMIYNSFSIIFIMFLTCLIFYS